MKQPSPKIHIGKFTISRKLFILLCVVIIAVPILFYVYNYSFLSPRNYAQEVAQPIEDALVKAGAVKKCDRGDNGRGIDNREPWYTSYFELPKNNQQAQSLIYDIADGAGYKLHQASAGTKGYLGDSVFLATAKSSSLAVALTNSGPLHACRPSSGDVFNDATHTAVSVEVRLPALQ